MPVGPRGQSGTMYASTAKQPVWSSCPYRRPGPRCPSWGDRAQRGADKVENRVARSAFHEALIGALAAAPALDASANTAVTHGAPSHGIGTGEKRRQKQQHGAARHVAADVLIAGSLGAASRAQTPRRVRTLWSCTAPTERSREPSSRAASTTSPWVMSKGETRTPLSTRGGRSSRVARMPAPSASSRAVGAPRTRAPPRFGTT